MPQYRLYFIDPTPRHIRDIMDFDAVDDDAALRQAAERFDGRALELWESQRLVKACGPDDS